MIAKRDLYSEIERGLTSCTLGVLLLLFGICSFTGIAAASVEEDRSAVADEWTAMPSDLHWVRNAAEYRALTRQVYAFATRELEARVASGEFEGKQWGVSMDAR